MESLRKQAAKLLGEQKKYKRWLAVFLCLALLVTSGTVAALKLNGQAQNYEKEVLECTLEVHEHTAECYEGGILYAGGDVSGGDAAGPACGYADYVVHVHNDNCRDKEGELVCQLPEIEPHVHDEGCYQEQRILVCGLEETEVHVHTEECRHLICGLGEAAEGEETEGTENPEGTEETPEGAGEAQNADVAENADNAENAGEAENGDDAEKAESHVHTEECRNMICGQEESQGHVHSDECRVLTCEEEEAQGHVHSDECRALICEQEESQGHVHTEACVSRVQGDLTCANTEEDHQHTDECYAWTEENICGQEEGEGAHAHTEDCYDAHACGQEEGEGSHAHTEECYDAHGCGLEEGEGSHVHTDECYDGYSCGLEEGAVENDENGGTVDTADTEDPADAGESAETTDPADSEDPADTEEPHVHTDECYDGYACGLEQGGLADPENGHVHGEECYAVLMVPSCGQLELHTHEAGCYDEAGSLVCGIPELKEHVHDKECIKVVELTKEEIEAIQAAEKGSGEGSGTAKTEHALYEKVYDDGSVRVTAQYDETANIPADAEMYVEIVPKSEDEAEAGEEGEEGTDPAEGNVDSEGSDPAEGNEGSEGSDAAEGEGTVAGNEEGTDAGSDSEDAADKEETDKDNEAVNDETASDAETDDAESGTDESGEGANTDDAETDDEQPGSDAEPSEEAEPIETTSEDVAAPSGENDADTQPETETDADEADLGSQPEETVPESGEQDVDAPAGSDDNAVPEDEEGDAISAEIEEKILQGKGRMEIVEEEVTYRIVFRLNGEEIEPEGSVTFTICDLENEESQPEEKTFTPGAGLEQMMFSLTRMVEVFVQTEFQKTYEDESIRVIAEYNKSANIPEEAELRVYEITPESDPERFADCEEKFKEAVEDENAEMSTLLEIGFYVDDEEIEPEDTVTMMVQFLDGEGQPIGDPINVVHFAAEGETEVLEDSEVDEDGYITFKTDSFSPFAFFNTVGATVAYGPMNANSGIPFYELEDGVLKEVASLSTDGWSSDAKGLYIVAAMLAEQGSSRYDSDYVKISSAGGTERWIAYSKIIDGEEKISTAKVVEHYKFGFLSWLCSGVSDVSEITGIYYLPGNKEEYENVSKEILTAKKYKAILNPGNGNGTSYLLQYGRNIGRKEVEINVIEEIKDADNVTQSIIGSVELPSNDQLTEDQKPSDYNFRLVGWYNIADQTYYNVENGPVVAEVDALKTNVFYADWVAVNYNFHDNGKTVKKTESTNDFIKTRIFDFNELFNIYSSTYESTEVNNEKCEEWTLEDIFREGEWQSKGTGRKLILGAKIGNPFIFLAARAKYDGGGSHDTINHPSNNGEEIPESFGNYSVADKLATNQWNLNKILEMLFSEDSNALGVHYVGEGDHLYYYNEKTGNYEYDSNLHAASYQEDEGRFYIYDDAQLILNEQAGPTTAFLPFNGSGNYYGDGSEVNYHFGMCSEINFYLPNAEDTSSTEGNKDLIFEFSGDDDVWVFLDGQLILDMGGIHSKLCGEINFTKKTWQTYQTKKWVGNENGGEWIYVGTENDPCKGKFSIEDTPYNEHKLTIYYMERGAGASNCKISFNIKPRYLYEEAKVETVKVEKEWKGIEKEDAPKVTVELYKEYYDGNEKKETVIDSQVLNNENNWTYVWEGLDKLAVGSEDRYKVREVGLSGYDVSTINTVTGSWKYWVQKPLKEGEILILNVDEDSNARVALGHDLNPVSVEVKNGAISPLAIKDIVNSIKWTAEEVQSKKEGETEKYYKLKFVDADGKVKYLAYDDEKTGLRLVENPDQAVSFKWMDQVGHGLQDSANDGRRIVYKDNQFSVDSCIGNGDGAVSDEKYVRIYMLWDDSSRVSNYKIINTYQPTITINKVDRDEVGKKLSGAKFTLTRSYTVINGEADKIEETTVKEYYDGDTKTWKPDDGKITIPSFEMKNGELLLKEAKNGDYILTEVEPPSDKYMELPNKVISFTVETTDEGSQIKDVICGQFDLKEGETSPENIAEIKPIAGKNLLLLVKNEKKPERTTKVVFTKNSTAPNNPPVGGAQFELYRELTAEEKEEAEKNHEDVLKLKVGDEEKDVVKITEGLLDESEEEHGIFFEGNLKTGIYYLKEIVPPDGYKPLLDIVTIEVKLEENGASSFTVSTKAGASSVLTKPMEDTAKGKYTLVQVLNTQGYELPETGSMGTKPFTIGGAMLIISAAAILMYGYSVRRRKSERRLNK